MFKESSQSKENNLAVQDEGEGGKVEAEKLRNYLWKWVINGTRGGGNTKEGGEGRCDKGVMTEESLEMDVGVEGEESLHYPRWRKSFNLDDAEMEFTS